MVEQPGRVSTWTLRAVVYGGFVAGVALVVAAVRSEDPPLWWWWTGTPLAVLCGLLASMWVWMRLRFRSKEERQAYLDGLEAKRDEVGRPLDRSRLAHRATRHKKAVLRSGVDTTATVTFLADGHRANEFHQLVYLELAVTPPGGGEPYQVRTGEFLNAASAGSVSPGRELRVRVDPADPQRVAVDWERSLRLT
jgi:hypothetical protein